MKKIIKNIISGLIIFLLFIGLIFGYGYYKKIKRDLVDYNIQEKIIVKFENDENKYLVNLNNGSYIEYNGEYDSYGYDFEINWDNDDEAIAIYNRKIYNQNNMEVYRYINSGFLEAYWSQDGKYIISLNGYIARMFGLFLQIETAAPVITIVEPETGKIKQLDILGKNGKYLDIEKILGYVLEN